MTDGFKDVEEIVILAGRLPAGINSYAGQYVEKAVTKVNGVKIKKIEDIENTINNTKDENLVFEFFDDPPPLVLPREEALSADKVIQDRYEVDLAKWFKGIEFDGATSEEKGEI